MRENQNMLLKISWAILLLIFVFALISSAHAQTDDEKDITPSQDYENEIVSKKDDSSTLMNYAIIGISFGGMFFVSSVHWLNSRRKDVEAEIFTLSTFINQTNTVEFSIDMSNDLEPMMNGLDVIQSQKENALNEHNGNAEKLMKTISEAEISLLRRLG